MYQKIWEKMLKFGSKMIFPQFIKSSNIKFNEIFGKILLNNKSNFDLKKSTFQFSSVDPQF